MATQPLLSAKMIDAFGLVGRLFQAETRRVSGDPYVAHLFGVCLLVSNYSQDDDVLLAALLHDVLEDISPKTYNETMMRQDFGDRTTDLVKSVSHIAGGDWRNKREIYLQQLLDGPKEASLISAADLVYNLSDLLLNNTRYPDETLSLFNDIHSKDRQWFYSERVKVLRTRLGTTHPLVVEVTRLNVEFLKLY